MHKASESFLIFCPQANENSPGFVFEKLRERRLLASARGKSMRSAVKVPPLQRSFGIVPVAL